MHEVFIVSACRTPIGSFSGQFVKISAAELGGIAIEESIKRAQLQPEDIEHVVMGHVLTSGQGQNTARQAAVQAKVPYSTTSYTINMICGSGLKTICLGYQAIKNNDYHIIVAGGQENMSSAQHSYDRRSGTDKEYDTLLHDGLTDAFYKVHMGNTAEHLAKTYNISRKEQEIYATKSQNKTEKAVKNGFFQKEIVSVLDKNTGNLISTDEFPRSNVTVEKLAKLKPCFAKDGTVTAATSSGLNDGAAAVVLCNEDVIKSKELRPLAKIIAFAESGVDPMCMGTGPVGAIQKVLIKAGWSKDEVDLYEINEAFAVQMIAVLKLLQIDEVKVNVSGGAIALGHPLGASGTRILVSLLYNLERLDKKKGIASLCIGGGMGIAIAVERCSTKENQNT